MLTIGRVGKVAAAATATQLISDYKVDLIVFVGVAGGVAEELNIGDLVIASSLIQHDLNASPIVPRFVVPLLGCSRFTADEILVSLARTAGERFLAHQKGAKLYVGTVGTGDSFVTCADQASRLRADLPDLLAVEMEGAAVAQVGYEYDVPVLVIRSISDNCNHSSFEDCRTFLQTGASVHSHGVLRELLPLLREYAAAPAAA